MDYYLHGARWIWKTKQWVLLSLFSVAVQMVLSFTVVFFFYWWRSLEKSPLTRAKLETGKTSLSGPDYFEPREGPS